MNSYSSMKEAAGEQKTSIISGIAHRMHIHPSTAYKWTQPSEDPTDSGNRNPVDMITQWIESCIILGRPRSAALAPLRHLNQHFDLISFPIPEHVKEMSHADLSDELISCMKELGDVVGAHEAAMQDKRMSRQDLEEIERQTWETVTQLMVYLHCAKEAQK